MVLGQRGQRFRRTHNRVSGRGPHLRIVEVRRQQPQTLDPSPPPQAPERGCDQPWIWVAQACGDRRQRFGIAGPARALIHDALSRSAELASARPEQFPLPARDRLSSCRHSSTLSRPRLAANLPGNSSSRNQRRHLAGADQRSQRAERSQTELRIRIAACRRALVALAGNGRPEHRSARAGFLYRRPTSSPVGSAHRHLAPRSAPGWPRQSTIPRIPGFLSAFRRTCASSVADLPQSFQRRLPDLRIVARRPGPHRAHRLRVVAVRHRLDELGLKFRIGRGQFAFNAAASLSPGISRTVQRGVADLPLFGSQEVHQHLHAVRSARQDRRAPRRPGRPWGPWLHSPRRRGHVASCLAIRHLGLRGDQNTAAASSRKGLRSRGASAAEPRSLRV